MSSFYSSRLPTQADLVFLLRPRSFALSFQAFGRFAQSIPRFCELCPAFFLSVWHLVSVTFHELCATAKIFALRNICLMTLKTDPLRLFIVLVIVATVIYAILAIAGSNDFETALNTLLVVLS